MSTFEERLVALFTRVELRGIDIDLGTWRRLQAMAVRVQKEDPTLVLPDDMKHIVYAAICGGLYASEQEAGLVFDETTGRHIGGGSLAEEGGS